MIASHVVLDPEAMTDRVVFRVGLLVYVWSLPTSPRSSLNLRRLSLDAPMRVRVDAPSFGGDDDTVPADRRVQADRLRRLIARATLYATPSTYCSTQDIADVFALREADVRTARPSTARRIGRAWMAPFGDWLIALNIDLEALADRADSLRRPAIREIHAPSSRPLGGPSRARGDR